MFHMHEIDNLISSFRYAKAAEWSVGAGVTAESLKRCQLSQSFPFFVVWYETHFCFLASPSSSLPKLPNNPFLHLCFLESEDSNPT